MKKGVKLRRLKLRVKAKKMVMWLMMGMERICIEGEMFLLLTMMKEHPSLLGKIRNNIIVFLYYVPVNLV